MSEATRAGAGSGAGAGSEGAGGNGVTDPSVLVCGAGPVGLSTALGLAHAGVASTVVDRKPGPDPHSRATLILPRTLEIFRQWGVLEPLLAAGSQVPHVRLREPGRDEEILHVNFTKLTGETSTPFALAIPQDHTERILLDAAAATGMIDVRFGTELTDIEQDSQGVGVHLGDTGARPATGIRRTDPVRRWQYLVGADGAHSTVRGHLGWELDGKTYPTPAMLADVRVDPARDQHDHWPTLLGHRGIVVAIRFGAGVWRIIEQAVDDTYTPPALDEHITALSTELFGPGPTEIIWRSIYRKHERCAARFRAGRITLAGDAAHLNSPAGGQGMNSGVQDAHNLAWKLAAAVTDPRADPDALLESYSQERVSLITRRVQPATDLAERYQTARPHRRVAITRALDTVFSFPHSSGALTERFAMLDLPYQPSRLLTGRDNRVGQRLPDAHDTNGRRYYSHLPHGGLLRAGPDRPEHHQLATDLGLPLVDGDVAALTRFFDRDRYLALIRPDHIIAAVTDPTKPQTETFRLALARSR